MASKVHTAATTFLVQTRAGLDYKLKDLVYRGKRIKLQLW